jgi:hypothetical protein
MTAPQNGEDESGDSHNNDGDAAGAEEEEEEEEEEGVLSGVSQMLAVLKSHISQSKEK